MTPVMLQSVMRTRSLVPNPDVLIRSRVLWLSRTLGPNRRVATEQIPVLSYRVTLV
jgi:hypothetical protein